LIYAEGLASTLGGGSLERSNSLSFSSFKLAEGRVGSGLTGSAAIFWGEARVMGDLLARLGDTSTFWKARSAVELLSWWAGWASSSWASSSEEGWSTWSASL
jgi:hypothetical protein